MLDIILNLISILDGYVYTDEYKKLSFINKNNNLINCINHLYNIAKNDKTINSTFITKLNNLISKENYYEAITALS